MFPIATQSCTKSAVIIRNRRNVARMDRGPKYLTLDLPLVIIGYFKENNDSKVSKKIEIWMPPRWLTRQSSKIHYNYQRVGAEPPPSRKNQRPAVRVFSASYLCYEGREKFWKRHVTILGHCAFLGISQILCVRGQFVQKTSKNV